MADLVAGVVVQLLQHMKTEVKVGGEHRSCLLQVIGIVPALAGSDLFSGHQGFYLRVSDSSHATYVSLPEEQHDLILSDKIQLGQFIHVHRLDPASPVPILRGLRPLPGRHPCRGSPKDIHAPAFLSNDKTLTRIKSLNRDKKNKTHTHTPGSPTSCYSLPTSFEKFANKVHSSHSQRKTITPTKKAASPSPMRSLVQGFDFGAKALRKSWEGTMELRPRNTTPSNPNPNPNPFRDLRVSTPRRSTSSDKFTPKDDNKVQVHSSKSKQDSKIRSTHTPTPTPTPIATKSKRATSNGSLDDQNKARPSFGKKSSAGDPTSNLVKVAINSRKLSETSVSWASLPSSLAKLGKEVMKQRDTAQTAAIDAIQEASAADTLLRCLSTYSELSTSAKEDNPQPAVEQYLALHSSLCSARTIADSLSKTTIRDHNHDHEEIPPPPPPDEALKVSSEKRKQASSWVQAALSTNLSPFSVFTKDPSQSQKNTAASTVLVIDKNAKPHVQTATQIQVQGKVRQMMGGKASGPRRSTDGTAAKPAVPEWERGNGLEEAVDLAEKLRLQSQDWFLGFVERFLDADVDSLSLSDNGQIAGMLTQLKSVNEWLDEISLSKDQLENNNNNTVSAETIDRLRKKIYEYLLTHVESAAAALGAGSPRTRPAEVKLRK